jgi:hypothetical protein
MSEMTEQERVRVRVTRVVEDAIYDANIYNLIAFLVIATLIVFHVWTWIIASIALANWLFLSDYFKGKAVKKAVDKLI